MITKLSDLFGHGECKRQLHSLMQAALDDGKKIQSLNSQIITLMTQIQELKAINDYQTFNLERKVNQLEMEVKETREKLSKGDTDGSESSGHIQED